VLLAGSTDHYVTLNIDPELASGVSGHPTFLHGQGELFRQSFIYVPIGATGLHIVAGEWDKPRTRSFKITAEDGTVLFPATRARGICRRMVIDRGGFGVRIELDGERNVSRGQNNTIMIELVAQRTSAADVEIEYRLVPFGE
jgi:hypothetical protein